MSGTYVNVNLSGSSGTAVPGLAAGGDLVTDGAGEAYDPSGNGGVLTTQLTTNLYAACILPTKKGSPTSAAQGNVFVELDTQNFGTWSKAYKLEYDWSSGSSVVKVYKFDGSGFGQIGSTSSRISPQPVTLLRNGNTLKVLDFSGNSLCGTIDISAYSSSIPRTGTVGFNLNSTPGDTAANHYGTGLLTYADLGTATSYTATDSASGSLTNGSPDTITLTANGTTNNTLVKLTSTVAGNWSQNPVQLNGTTPVTVTFTPTTTGTGTISFGNYQGLSNPTAINITVGSSSPTLTLSPTTATAVDGVSTVSLVPTLTNSTASITKSVSGGGTLSGGSSATSGSAFTYTPPATGSGNATVTVNDPTDGLSATCTIAYGPPLPTGHTIYSGTFAGPTSATTSSTATRPSGCSPGSRPASTGSTP